jgi:hypothetical protein
MEADAAILGDTAGVKISQRAQLQRLQRLAWFIQTNANNATPIAQW